MPRADRPRRRRGAGRLTVVTAAAALLCGGWLIADGAATSQPPQPDPAPTLPAPGPATPPSAVPASVAPPAERPGLPPSLPVRLRVPVIGVNAAMTPLDLDPQGRLSTPPADHHDLAGWYRGGATPGADGVAVVVGHVDDRHGPSVFFLLGRLHAGALVSVDRADRTTATFTVDAVRSYPKSAFPTAQVYAPTGRPELRLITCGGHYDHRTGYQSNIVVYAHLTATSR